LVILFRLEGDAKHSIYLQPSRAEGKYGDAVLAAWKNLRHGYACSDFHGIKLINMKEGNYMLKGFLMRFFMIVPTWLAYGNKGMAVRKELGRSNVLSGLISIGLALTFLLTLTFKYGMPGSIDAVTSNIILFGVPILYIVYVIYARHWTKKYAALLEQEKAQKRKEELARRVEAERKAKEAAQKEEAKKQQISQALASGEIDLHAFVEIASECRTFHQLLSLWDSSGLTPDSPIREEIASHIKTERMYGSNPREVTNFLKNLLQKQEKTIQLSEERKMRNRLFQQEKANLERFVNGASDCKTFEALLAAWDAQDHDENELNEKIHKTIVSKVAVEKRYGSFCREITAFLNGLLGEDGVNPEIWEEK
jgi:hypothetical protein